MPIMLRRCWRIFVITKNSGKMSEIGHRLAFVLDKVERASAQRGQELQYFQPRLVAVSKTKPIEDIINAYQAGQRIFGENYVNELLEKASDEKLVELCPDIRWHFIGRLQRNKVNKVARLTALAMVETLDSARLADSLNAAREKSGLARLGVMVQVNTSGEENKGGVEVGEAEALALHVQRQCPSLVLTGLMTIGAFNHDPATGPNPDFQRLIKCRESVCTGLAMTTKELELSMGMSSDYEHAILVGSTNVRVGSEIFGARLTKSAVDGEVPPAPSSCPSGGDSCASSASQHSSARMSACQ